MEPTGKNFRKRNAILSCLRRSKAHPSAEALYQELHREYPDISLATVYRNLALFRSQGLAQCVGTVNGMERFDGDISPHVHFVCTGCGTVLDMPEITLPDCSAQAEKSGCRVRQAQLTLTGLCRDCLAKEEKITLQS